MREKLGTAGTASRIVDDIEVLRRHALKISETTNRLLAFSRATGARPSQIDVNRLMEECVALVQPRLESRDVTLNLNFSHGLPLISGHPNRLEETVVNILNNAIDAVDSGGQIYLITALTGGAQRELLIIVADNGAGISAEDLPRIFDPFYTTKDVDKGTGLGLYIAHQIVEEHSGIIDVQSELGRGTTVTITFPVPSADKPAPEHIAR